SFLSVRRNMRLVFAGVALIGASLALGGFNPMYRWMYEHVPGFSLGRYPSKYFLMSALALAILSALGLEFLLMGEKLSAHGRRELFVLGAGGIVIAVSLLGTWVWLQAHPAYLSDYIRAQTDPVKNVESMVSQLLVSLRRTCSPARSAAWSTYYCRLTGQPMYRINNRIQYALYESVDLLTTRESEALWREYQRCSGEDAFRLFQKLNVGQRLTVRGVRD